MTATLASLIECIQPELLAVDRLFSRELESEIECVNVLVRHVSRFRGKMLRPCLVLLSGLAAAPSRRLTDAHVTIATVSEMVHMATLVHDDVLDEAELRRKGATLNHLRGNEAAVMLGDYLISHSYHLCASLQSQYASRLIAYTTNQVCEGELLQIENRGNLELDEETYYRIIGRKTAILCSTCCELGAKLSSADDQAVNRLGIFGMSLGIAFQIQDDILDIVGEQTKVGKTLGIDLEKGKMTLPMIHFLQTAPREHQALLRSLLEAREPDMGERVRNLILPSDSIQYAKSAARQQVERAKLAISDLRDSEAKQVLETMADFVIRRSV